MAQLKSRKSMQAEIEAALEKGDMVAIGELAMDYAKRIGSIVEEAGIQEAEDMYDYNFRPVDASGEVTRLRELYRERFGGYGGSEQGNGRDISVDLKQEDDGQVTILPQAQGNYIPGEETVVVRDEDIFDGGDER